jgi:hypothetical protein
MIGDTDLKVSKLYGMLPADTSGTSDGRTPANNATVRNVFIIGPDKRSSLIAGLSHDHGAQFRRDPAGDRFHAADQPAQGGDAGDWKQGEDVIITGAVNDEAPRSCSPATRRSSPICAPPRNQVDLRAPKIPRRRASGVPGREGRHLFVCRN